MSKFFDRIIAAGRSELASARLGNRAGGAPRVSAASEPATALDAGSESLSVASFEPTPATQSPGPHAPVPPLATPTTPLAALTAPTAPLAALTAPLAPLIAQTDGPPVRTAELSPARTALQARTADQARSLAGAWLETSTAPRSPALPRAPQPTVAAVDLSAAPAPSIPQIAASAARSERPHHVDSPAAQRPTPARSAAAPVIAAPAPQRAPATAPALQIDQLDIRIVSEAPRAPAAPPVIRAPSQLGAWRPSARRFLGRP